MNLDKIVESFRLNLFYSNKGRIEVFHELSDSLSKATNTSIEVIESNSSSGVIDLELNGIYEHITNMLQEGKRRDSVQKLDNLLRTKKSFYSNVSARIAIPSTSINPDNFSVRSLLQESTDELLEVKAEAYALMKTVNKNTKGKKFNSVKDIETMLQTFVTLPIPYTGKTVLMRKKDRTEITLTPKRLLQLSSLAGSLILFLEKRVADWVLLKLGIYVVWTYIFWMLLNEFVEIDMVNIPPNTKDELMQLNRKIKELKND